MSNQDILIIENDRTERIRLKKLLESWGYQVTTVLNAKEADKNIIKNNFVFIIVSFQTPNLDPFELIKKVKKNSELTQIIFVSKETLIQEAVNIVKAGALDFVLKPIDDKSLRIFVDKAFDIQKNKDNATKNKTVKREIITKNKKILELLSMAKKIANSDASVLIQGESGTGKELFARFIHSHSDRKDKPFIALNCAALPENLLESELFGYEKGSFTGASSKRIGKFEQANAGTLLLDEITEMQIHLQSKLLRVLQEREVDRIGGEKSIKIDVRIIAITNRKVEKAIKNNKFREDLFYRLNIIPFEIPPLREREEDIILLANHFIDKFNKIDNKNIKGLTDDAISTLRSLEFKGNAREMENIIRRAVLLAENDLIEKEDLFFARYINRNKRARN